MTRNFILLYFLILSVPVVNAQEAKLLGQREIMVYKAVAKTLEGTIKGVLQRATPDRVLIVTDTGTKSVCVKSIKWLKIKFDKKRNVQVFQKIAQAGVDIVVDPQYTRTVNSYGKDMNGNLIPLDEKDAPLGERLLIGSATLAGALVSNELAKFVPPATIETFKIGYSREKYSSVYENLSMYTVDMQSSPDYELILKEKLKQAIKKNKLTP